MFIKIGLYMNFSKQTQNYTSNEADVSTIASVSRKSEGYG